MYRCTFAVRGTPAVFRKRAAPKNNKDLFERTRPGYETGREFPMPMRFEILEHPSDLGIQARGGSLQDAFCNAAFGLMSIIAGLSAIEPREGREVRVFATDREKLLVRWLAEILYLFDAEKFLTCGIKFESFAETSLKARLSGEPYDAGKHELKLDVKAITYHQLNIEEHDGLWTARVFVDV